jgi:CO/xanthine dehydrogenase Mo-binding subunit
MPPPSPKADLPPLGVGEASGGPTVAAIGNAVAHALGTRLRDLPPTRERIMAAVLKTLTYPLFKQGKYR